MHIISAIGGVLALINWVLNVVQRSGSSHPRGNLLKEELPDCLFVDLDGKKKLVTFNLLSQAFEGLIGISWTFYGYFQYMPPSSDFKRRLQNKDLNFMKGFSAILAIFQLLQNGTFELFQEIKFFWPKALFRWWDIVPLRLYSFYFVNRPYARTSEEVLDLSYIHMGGGSEGQNRTSWNRGLSSNRTKSDIIYVHS